MAKFNEYTVKATPEDADTLMLYDAASKANKLSPFSGIWNYMVNKLTNAVINNLQTSNKTVVGALNELNSKAKIGGIKYISCGEYGTLAAFTVGKLLYCKFNGNDKNSQSVQTNVAQLPGEYILNDSIGVYRTILIGYNDTNIGNIQIKTDGNIDIYCPYPYLYGYVIIPIK